MNKLKKHKKHKPSQSKKMLYQSQVIISKTNKKLNREKQMRKR